MRQPVQMAYAFVAADILQLELPPADAEVLQGIRWGAFDEVGTPAYWRVQAWHHERLGTYNDRRLGRSLAEELAACLLGGYGMPAELALAAYRRLRCEQLIYSGVKQEPLEEALSEPFAIDGRPRRYRFAKQKAHYLSRCLSRLDGFDSVGRSDVALRDSLAEFPGVGPKTASWIVRNYRDSDAIAILDVHIVRAGRIIGLFDAHADPQRHYRRLEEKFLLLARAVGVRAALLDAMIWDHLRRISHALPQSMHCSSSALGTSPAEEGSSSRGQLQLSV